MGVSVCMSVCLSAGVSRKLGVLDFSKLSASVAYGRVSELVWWRCDMLFVDDAIHVHSCYPAQNNLPRAARIRHRSE